MWKIREIQEKVTNVVMNYSEIESKVREATNDDEWGPHGGLMQEVAQYTYQYEHFPEVMGMLWKRMFEEQRKNWRRSYKGLLLLAYLIKNGSERVVTSAREHLYDLRGLETYTFIDEFGKDQGINIRQKSKELVELIQDDERLREERRKARKNKDKYIGLAGGISSPPAGVGGGPYRGGGPGGISSLDSWDPNKQDTIGEKIHSAIDTIGTIWKESRKKSFEDDPPPGGIRGTGFHNDDDFEFRDTPPPLPPTLPTPAGGGGGVGSGGGEFRDDFEETQQIEKKTTTTTEKRTTTIKHTSVRSSLGKDDETKENSIPSISASNNNESKAISDLLDLSLPSPVHASASANAVPLQPKSSTTSVNGSASVDPGANANGDFGDFSGFQSASTAATPVAPPAESNDDFADFSSAFGGPSASSGPTAFPVAPVATPAPVAAPVAAPASVGGNFDLLSQAMTSPATATVAPFQPNPVSHPIMGIAAPLQQQPPLGSAAFGAMSKPVQPVPPMQMMNQQQQPPMFAAGGMNNGIIGGPVGMMASGMQPNPAGGSTWSDVKGSVDISLDGLAPHSKLQPRGQAGPTLAQMQQQNTIQMNSLTMQIGQASIGGMQPVSMGGMMPQQNQQMGFGAPMVAVNPGLGAPGAPPMISPTSAAKENLQKKADQAFADLAVFK